MRISWTGLETDTVTITATCPICGASGTSTLRREQVQDAAFAPSDTGAGEDVLSAIARACRGAAGGVL